MTDLHTPKQLAELLSVDLQTLSNWRYLRRGPKFVKSGRVVRYLHDDVVAWLSKQTVSTN